MGCQGDRQNYNWRPNDNSSQTRLRYDLEMNHWLKSLKSSSSNGSGVSGNWGATFAVIGLILNFIVIGIWLLLILISDVITWIVNQFDKPKPDPKTWRPTPIGDDELDKMWDRMEIKSTRMNKENSS